MISQKQRMQRKSTVDGRMMHDTGRTRRNIYTPTAITNDKPIGSNCVYFPMKAIGHMTNFSDGIVLLRTWELPWTRRFLDSVDSVDLKSIWRKHDK